MSKIKFYLLFLGLILILLFSFSITEDKTKIIFEINSINSYWADIFFKYITYLGSGIFLGLIALISFFKQRFIFYTTLVSIVLLLIFVNISKVIVKEPRPLAFFEQKEIETKDLHKVEGVEIHRNNSFPSGHSATAAAIFTILAVWTAQKKFILQFLYISIVLCVAYSRLYLLQHFLLDVVVGMALGLGIVVWAYYFLKYVLKIEYKKTSKTYKVNV